MIEKIEKYLLARGCEVGKIKGRLLEFRLPGDTSRSSGGCVSMSNSGSLKMWHRYAEKGLQAGDPWIAAGLINIGNKQVPAHSCHINDLHIEKNTTALAKVPKFTETHTRQTSDPEQVRRAADENLKANGFAATQIVDRYTDGTDDKPVVKLHVSDDGVATVFSFRNNLDLSDPWRFGRQNSAGHQTFFATGRDLGLDGDIALNSMQPVLPRIAASQERAPANLELNRDTYKAWKAGEKPVADHRHLSKSGAVLDGSDLRVYPSGHKFAGTIMAPMFRPAPKSASDTVELCGVQHLMPRVTFGTDKIMAKGSQLAGAFVPFPSPDSIIKKIGAGALAPIVSWLEITDKSKPLVICEGVATGLAIHQSGAGNTLCSLSSSNVMSVAKWVKNSGIADFFPSVVIATDHDIGRDGAGRLKSNAIPKALEAAKATNFLLAIPPKKCPVGADARDLMGCDGPQSVRNFIESATTATVAENARNEIFLSQIQNKDTEIEFER